MLKNEKGYIVIETMFSFLLFLLLIISILSLVNISVLQARIHYAMTQTAKTLSMYSYALEVTGIADEFKAIDDMASPARVGIDELKSNINGVFDGISSLSAESIGSSVSGAAESGTELFSDPAGFFNLLLADTIDHLFADYVIRPMVGRYLTNGDITGDRYLKSVNVTDGLDGLKFHGFDYLDLAAASEMNSSFIDKDGDITLTVRYDVAYSFLILPLPFAELSITQSVKTKAWLGGKGERYQP